MKQYTPAGASNNKIKKQCTLARASYNKVKNQCTPVKLACNNKVIKQRSSNKRLSLTHTFMSEIIS